jgi:phenylpropionate dioxygenase-like ring-hydroxylating dioxygenase large terminal subunit
MTYVHNAWYVTSWAHEIRPEHPVGARILNQPIVIWRNAARELVAFEDRCFHRLAPLSLGRCEGESLRCMYHGLLYDRTGHVIEIPGQERIPNNARVRRYPVIERYGWVWIWMGDAEQADERLIPPVGGSDYSDYVVAHGQLDYAAEARLVNENLLELSHAVFLHSDSFRYGETWALDRPKIMEQERGIFSERWIKNQGLLGVKGADPSVDTYFCYEFYVPGALLMTYRSYPVGTADALNGQRPDPTEAIGGFTGDEGFTRQAVTPLTDKTARYLYIHGARRRGGETVYDMTVIDKAFAEDKVMIEAQQRNIDTSPGARFVPTSADRGIVLFNRIVDRLVRAEASRVSEASAPHRIED